MSQVTVHLLRHGEVFNPDGVLYGRLPEFHLSERGRAMAVLVAEHFATLATQGAAPVYLVASPLTRAQETAQPTAEALGLDIVTDPRIIEAENHFEGLVMSPAELRKPKHWPYFVNPFKPSWGEAYSAQAERMLAAARDARRRAFELGGDGAQAIMVSHQLPIHAAKRRRAAPVARPPQSRMHAGFAHVIDVRRRRRHRRGVQRTGGRIAAGRGHHPRGISTTAYS